MEPSVVQAVIEAAQNQWDFANDIEITLEANPTSVEVEKFRAFNLAGVNRVSVGVQALDDGALVKLGRLHSAKDALRAVDVANSVFGKVSFDLIYARQDQSLMSWEQELTQALGYGPDHISLYQLTIEDGTAFGDRFHAGKLKGLPNEDLGADMFQLTQEITNAFGLPSYEISNHAKPEQFSRHNMIYWQAGDWVGVGPGAHGRLTLDGRRYATTAALAPTTWLETLGQDQKSLIDPKSAASEYLMMGLRTNQGVDLDRLDVLQPELSKNVDELCRLDLLRFEQNHLIATTRGKMILNGILRELLPD